LILFLFQLSFTKYSTSRVRMISTLRTAILPLQGSPLQFVVLIVIVVC
jgi:hypothetical protein